MPRAHPGGGAQHPGLPDRGGQPDCCGEHGGEQVTAAGRTDPARRFVGERTTEQLGDPEQCVRESFDDPQGAGGAVQDAGEEAGEHGGGDLVAAVAEQARRADADHPW